ncbi:unnamed protein product, partial [Oppiella nova]
MIHSIKIIICFAFLWVSLSIQTTREDHCRQQITTSSAPHHSPSDPLSRESGGQMSFWTPNMPEVDISSVTTRVNQLSNEELKQLLNDNNYHKLDEMIKDLPQIRSLERERDLLIETNKSSAEQNLSREPTYRQTRQQLIDGHNELKTLKEEIDKKKSRLSE